MLKLRVGCKLKGCVWWTWKKLWLWCYKLGSYGICVIVVQGSKYTNWTGGVRRCCSLWSVWQRINNIWLLKLQSGCKCRIVRRWRCVCVWIERVEQMGVLQVDWMTVNGAGGMRKRSDYMKMKEDWNMLCNPGECMNYKWWDCKDVSFWLRLYHSS